YPPVRSRPRRWRDVTSPMALSLVCHVFRLLSLLPSSEGASPAHGVVCSVAARMARDDCRRSARAAHHARMGGPMPALLQYITINLDPVLIKTGPFSLRWYGLMYVVGIAVGLLLVLPYARARGLTSDQVWNIFWGVAIAALIGGRLYYVLQNDPGSYLQHP